MKKYILLFSFLFITSLVPLSSTAASLGLSVRGGLFIPTGSKNVTSIWGASYELMNLGPLKGSISPGSINISADYYAPNSHNRRIPILLNYKKDILSFYLSAGAGFSINTVRSSLSDDQHSLSFAYQFSVGHNMLAGLVPLFVEARYLGAAGSKDVQSLNGIGLFAGVRF